VAAVVAAVALGGGLVGLAAAGPDGPAPPQTPNRYAVSAAGNSTLLLDSATGDTWVLAPGKEPSWVPVRRPAAAAEPARPRPEEPRPAARPPEPTQATFQISGYLVPARSAQVAAPAAGVVSQVLVREGDEVKAGDTLVVLDDAEAKLAVDAARADLVRAKENSIEFERTFKAGAIGTVERRKAEAELKQAEVALLRAEVRLKATRVTAPFAGTVVKVGTAPGEAVRPDGPPVAVVATLRELEAAFDVPESEVTRVSVGQACVIRVAAGEAEYAGEVVRVSPVIDPAKATAQVRAKLTLTGGGPAPRPGSFVMVRLTGKK
jgi:membrane fusion protein (multidrug efflux system)